MLQKAAASKSAAEQEAVAAIASAPVRSGRIPFD
jgi:hypothetical protein